ncbi:MAG: biopolymer transporter ExbD [Phycisphaerales bacterium]|nr:biopolymer transporter ExbD [Phycisphaerales bacterium]
MRRLPMPNIREGGVNVTPLIDIVMCLIIFFMLVAKIGITTGAEPMDLPETILGQKIEDLGNTLTLNVHRGQGNQPRVMYLPKNERINREIKLSQNEGGKIHHPLLEVLKAARRTNPRFKVIIRAPKDLGYELIEPILQACAAADLNNINFTTAQVMELRPE